MVVRVRHNSDVYSFLSGARRPDYFVCAPAPPGASPLPLKRFWWFGQEWLFAAWHDSCGTPERFGCLCAKHKQIRRNTNAFDIYSCHIHPFAPEYHRRVSFSVNLSITARRFLRSVSRRACPVTTHSCIASCFADQLLQTWIRNPKA